MSENPRFLSATSIVGDKVINPAGQELGRLKDLMIDLEAGRVAYAVLVTQEPEGKLFAIPWPMFRVDSERECFILQVSRELLETAPGMEDEGWPKHATGHEWLARIYQHYGHKRYW